MSARFSVKILSTAHLTHPEIVTELRSAEIRWSVGGVWNMSSNDSISRPMLVTLIIALAIACMPGAVAGPMDRIRQDKAIRIAYRADAPPFSFTTAGTEPEGSWSISVELS